MPNNKKKSVSNIKGVDKAHPYSRKAQQAQRAILRESHLAKKKAERDEPKRLAVERLLWFKFAVPDTTPAVALTPDEIHATIDLYIDRNADEMARLATQAQARKNRPRPPQLALLEALREKDVAEYAGVGIEVPVLTDPENVAALKAWEGDYNSMALVKMVRVRNPVTVAAEREAKARAAAAEKEAAAARAERAAAAASAGAAGAAMATKASRAGGDADMDVE
ncbi:translation machinery-associated protein 16 [Polyrhizophydium stewartii]|uniref:Translation machinery-associated protein 16 n=1 Tax=Polyrhizophydium stewartii TaxID=2732419 RepID=A0ABR4NHF2_9FUNG|nr:hypothetical protein HK105_002824 [Polyrhizophydium stewartii]